MKSEIMNIVNVIRQIGKGPLMIYAIALVLRLLYLLVMLPQIGPEHIVNQMPDTATYIEAADYLFGRSLTGQYELYLAGVGYPLFLGICTMLFGKVYWLILLMQIMLSSLSCVFIYKIARLLIKIKIVSLIAGILAAISLTSISLANALLTETLFFFLFTLSLYLFFKGMSTNSWRRVIIAGVLIGLAVLVRSAVLFFPVLLVIFAVLFPVHGQVEGRRQLILKGIVAALIMVSIMSIWGIRNKVAHDSFTVSGTGMGAAQKYLAAGVLYITSPQSSQGFIAFRDSLYRESLTDFNSGNYAEYHGNIRRMVISTFRQYPSLFIETYISNIWDNITVTSALHHVQIPRYKEKYEAVEQKINYGFNNPLVLILTITGFFILARRNLNIAVILLMIPLYFALMSGVTFGQGSRIFFPAQAVQPIMVAVSLVFLYDLLLIGRNLLFLRRKHQNS
ncbi:MAG: hypothetical protein DRP46_05815 [Candidatus Zixiibacteriota bacterium]|nr:MAG: hypothetical protein DRP46_05815 [candidate division Zixibacteria bacterium]